MNVLFWSFLLLFPLFNNAEDSLRVYVNSIPGQTIGISLYGQKYYWEGHVVNDTDKICKYELGNDDEKFKNVEFPNGKRPAFLIFECKSSESYCGSECCENSSWFTKREGLHQL
ncbi:CX domain-containing protein [Caenorhabditis elegans]|uniref:CX domain-containing protein n=1 Tax=Caenorhabditis elegans TaxID=6239 RepID=A0A2C9C3U3_CAEEL|nr:CX domain-containing protein [Caenorhabditis elegans]SOF58840.1 CX domain-containing protein [Caenorhabditis elegans]|eukprot:NP_001343840.1 Uncharacterized protein CELE_F21C10.19 [Caenorhabditis elegans]